MTHRIHVSDLQKASTHRPPGYLQEVMESGVVEGEHLLVEDEKYQALCQKFSPVPARQDKSAVTITRPGALLSILIRQLTGQTSAGCAPCSARAKQMDAWGWIGCWQNRTTIAQWLIEEAGKLGRKTDERTALGLLRSFLGKR